MVARLTLLAAAVAALVFGIARHHEAGRCADARSALFHIGARQAPAAGVPAAVRELEDACRGGSDLASGAGSLQRIGQTAVAGRLAREAVRREPGNEDGWVALALVARRAGDRATARAAVARVRALDPRSRFSVQ